MGTYSEAIAAVSELTRRGADKAGMIKRKINGAVQLIATTANWPRDLEEYTFSGSALVANSCNQTLELPARTRKVAYVQDGTRYSLYGQTGEVEQHDYGYVLANPWKADICYVAGTKLQARLAMAPTILNVGVYRFPEQLVVGTVENHWILDEMFELVVDYSSAWILTMLGDRELVGNITGLAGQQLQVFLQDRLAIQYAR